MITEAASYLRGRSEGVPVLFVEASHEADEGLLIVYWGARGIGVEPVAEILMERLIVPTRTIGAQSGQCGVNSPAVTREERPVTVRRITSEASNNGSAPLFADERAADGVPFTGAVLVAVGFAVGYLLVALAASTMRRLMRREGSRLPCGCSRRRV